MAPTPEPPIEQEKPATRPEPKFDAKEYLGRTLPRKPGDLLKIFPMHGGNSFRVNWYASRDSQERAIPGLNIAYIRESKFLYCRLNAQGTPEITYPAKQ
jgi:hypothetical protein